mgnify:CR=1 FL=1
MPRTHKTRNVRTSVRDRWISIQGAITVATATNFEKSLAKLAQKNAEPIVVFLESPGGETFACLAIYFLITNLIKKQTPVYTVGVGTARSGAFFVSQAGVRRFATKATRFLFHRTQRFSNGRIVDSVPTEEELRELATVDIAQLLLYTERGRPARTIQKLFKRGAKIGTKTALKLNLIDAVIPRGSFSNMRSLIVC